MLEKVPPELAGLSLAVFLAIVRIWGDERDNKFMRIFIETVICGCLSLTFSFAVLAVGMSVYWSAFIGGMIGYLGSTTLHAIAVKIIHSKIDKMK